MLKAAERLNISDVEPACVVNLHTPSHVLYITYHRHCGVYKLRQKLC